MTCEVCLPKERGYTLFFSEDQSIENVKKYFHSFPTSDYLSINERMLWLREALFFDVIDYIESHLSADHIYAVLSSRLDPLKSLHELKKVILFKQEREASWIDILIENRSICTYYQPIVNVISGKINIAGYELLTRGIDENGELISPFKMFEAARVRNKVFALDRVCRMEAVKNASLVTDKLIFINFIPTAIYVPQHCLSSTFEVINQLDIKPEQVVFEVVETDEVKDVQHLQSILDYYRVHGFKYALDDVGTGFNNLSLLAQMKPDFVKLAIEFTNGVSKDKQKQKIAEEVLQIAHQHGSMALAEGVELEEDFIFLQKMGYDLFQGYYFAKPQDRPIEKIEIEI